MEGSNCWVTQSAGRSFAGTPQQSIPKRQAGKGGDCRTYYDQRRCERSLARKENQNKGETQTRNTYWNTDQPNTQPRLRTKEANQA